jgi:hypothetical protein
MDMVMMGLCGSCGGDVMAPPTWSGHEAPPMFCASCGRSAAAGKPPTFEMAEPAPEQFIDYSAPTSP